MKKLLFMLCMSLVNSFVQNKNFNKGGLSSSKNPKNVKYNYDPRIHTLGNVGVGGMVHSLLAAPFTWLLDQVAYDGRDVRFETAIFITKQIKSVGGYPDENSVIKILDVGCGVGISTLSLAKAIYLERPELKVEIVGIDSSSEMLFHTHLYKLFWNNIFKSNSTINFICDDIENYYHNTSNGFDFIFCSLMFHEIPENYWKKIFCNFKRNLSTNKNFGLEKSIVILDIHPSYIPSKEMLEGEPFIFEYLSNFDKQFKTNFGYGKVKRKDIIEDRLTRWVYKK